MAPKKESSGTGNKTVVMHRGAWTSEEDRKLSEFIEVHGPRRWKNIATKAGLNRCGKSCRLRWLNYLRPNIKRGNISCEEEDLILRLHKLLGNRWSLIAGRLPGRTDNEIKNYWNSHLSKKINAKEKTKDPPQPPPPPPAQDAAQPPREGFPEATLREADRGATGDENPGPEFDMNDFFYFSAEGSYGLDWVNKFLELDDNQLNH
ncbi:hypothetical protein MLD38_023518 [Melastoma candidum]|uniref:Uncharacterized protein n=1 Tax=Melastoma candidum TaxID=119954 RepID=A0ACB9NQJ2_9MYRT|nr:hypothetical protein MLD38_023518 [Melastoma candidum]